MNRFGRLSLLPCMLALLFPLGAQADCQQWDATGGWSAIQSNISADSDHTQPLFSLEQSGPELRGTASFHRGERGEGDRDYRASVDGMIKGNTIELTAYWDDHTIGIYKGSISSLGRAEGDTYDRYNPDNKAHWYSDRRFNCLATAPVLAATVGFGRVAPRTASAPGTTICDAAKSARARNSPAAPGLEKQCTEYRIRTAAASTSATETRDDHSEISALLHPDSAAAPAALPPVDPAQLDAFAATGAKIAQIDPAVAQARSAETGAFYQLGFDIATGLFGDPALGAKGNTATGPGSGRIRDSLSAAGQRGFDASVKFHLARDYRH